MNILEDQGEDLAPLYEQTHLSVELLRDSSYWISAPDMEAFLEAVMRLPLKREENFCNEQDMKVLRCVRGEFSTVFCA